VAELNNYKKRIKGKHKWDIYLCKCDGYYVAISCVNKMSDEFQKYYHDGMKLLSTLTRYLLLIGLTRISIKHIVATTATSQTD
jgi:hypothetical protein